MTFFALALFTALQLDFSRGDVEGAFVDTFASYRGFSREEKELFCKTGDTASCIMLFADSLYDENIPTEYLYRQLAAPSGPIPEQEISLFASKERAVPPVAVFFFVTQRWHKIDPGMLRPLIKNLPEPYFSKLWPLYLRRLLELDRVSDFMQDYRSLNDEATTLSYLRQLLKTSPDTAFDFAKKLPSTYSGSFYDSAEKLFSGAFAKEKGNHKKELLLWQMMTSYRKYRYDRCQRIGKSFPKSDALRDAYDWRANLIRAMALTKTRDHDKAIAIYRNLEERTASFSLENEDYRDLFRWGGYSYGAAGKNEESVEYYLSGYEMLKATDGDDFLFYAADMERISDHSEAAEKLYRELIEKYPESEHRSVADFLLFWIQYSEKRWKEAAQTLSSIATMTTRSSYDSERARYWLARVEEKQGHDTEAIDLYREITTEHPFSYYGLLATSKLRKKNLSCDATPQSAPLSAEIFSNDALMPELVWAAALQAADYTKQANLLLSLVKKNVVGKGTPKDRLFAAYLARELKNFNAAASFVRSLPAMEGYSSDIARMQYPIGYEKEIVPHADFYNVPPLFVFSIARQESLFETAAVSSSNAIGILQLLPSTAQLLAKEERFGKVSAEQLKKPLTNVRFGVKFLGVLLKRYGNNMALAAAAYNAGPGKVDRWVKKMNGQELDEFVENIPIFQTRNYVKRVLANYAAYHFLYEGTPYDSLEFTITGPQR